MLHIDFGDCFEVAINRAKFPERVPFRLTRMLVNAMGVSGVEGNFRCTCEGVMGVLRLHKDSVMAMLEAFLHDPLISWNLEGRAVKDEALKVRRGSRVVARRACAGCCAAPRRACAVVPSPPGQVPSPSPQSKQVGNAQPPAAPHHASPLFALTFSRRARKPRPRISSPYP